MILSDYAYDLIYSELVKGRRPIDIAKELNIPLQDVLYVQIDVETS